MEKKPEELGRLFEVVLNQSGKYLKEILPLETKLKTIFDAHQSTMAQQVNRKALIKALIALGPTNEPAKFLKIVEGTERSIENQMREVDEKLLEVVYERTITLGNRLEAIKLMINLIPLKHKELVKRYKLITLMLVDGGIISVILKELDDVVHARSFRKKKKQRAMFFIQIFGSNTLSMIEYLVEAYNAENEFALNEAVAWFDRTVKIIQDCIDMIVNMGMDKYLEEQVIIDQKVDEYDISELYANINEKGLEIEKLLTMIDSKEKIDELLILLKNDIILITERQKLLKFREEAFQRDIAMYEERLNDKQYLLGHFWDFIILRLSYFPNSVTDQLNTPVQNDWEEARKRYALVRKINLILSNIQSVFQSLVKAYDQSMTNLRQAKRNYKRYADASSRVGLEKCMLYPVEINDKATWILNRFNKLCRSLNSINAYVKDTDLFYTKNVDDVEALYRELNLGLRIWSQLFIDMFRKV